MPGTLFGMARRKSRIARAGPCLFSAVGLTSQVIMYNRHTKPPFLEGLSLNMFNSYFGRNAHVVQVISEANGWCEAKIFGLHMCRSTWLLLVRTLISHELEEIQKVELRDLCGTELVDQILCRKRNYAFG